MCILINLSINVNETYIIFFFHHPFPKDFGEDKFRSQFDTFNHPDKSYLADFIYLTSKSILWCINWFMVDHKKISKILTFQSNLIVCVCVIRCPAPSVPRAGSSSQVRSVTSALKYGKRFVIIYLFTKNTNAEGFSEFTLLD